MNLLHRIDQNDKEIADEGNTGTNTEEAKEKYRKKV